MILNKAMYVCKGTVIIADFDSDISNNYNSLIADLPFFSMRFCMIIQLIIADILEMKFCL